MVSDIEIGDLLLVRQNDVYEDLIAFGERISLLRQGKPVPRGHPVYGHVAVYIGNGTIIEAVGRGVVRSPASKYLGSADIYTRPTTEAERQKIRYRAMRLYIGDYKYSWWLIAILAVRLLFGWQIPWQQKYSLVCSVLAYDAWEPVCKIAAERACTPEDLATYKAVEFKCEWVNS